MLTPPPIAMRPGALIDYRLSLRGVPMRWRCEIFPFRHGALERAFGLEGRTTSGPVSIERGHL